MTFGGAAPDYRGAPVASIREGEVMDVTIEEYAGPRHDLAWSFREAEDSEELLDAYIDLGRIWVAVTTRGEGAGETVGHLQAVRRDDDAWEVTNTAVAPAWRGRGVGRALLERAVEEAVAAGISRIVLATATADMGNLRFYQRCGFRMTHVVPDVFVPERGYPPGLEVDGIPLLDQVWFERILSPTSTSGAAVRRAASRGTDSPGGG
jgi:ribosomal protein S18 acetylase RimI-like enzyme